MSINVTNITKIYGQQKALNNVSFSINTGEIVGLLGPNGAGKSTMMKIITCFIPQTEGDVSVCGFDVVENSLEVRKKVGYLPESNPLYFDMYVREYLEFIAGIHKMGNKTKSRIDEMIEITGLQVEQNKKLGTLSKGYKQRVGLAQALIHDPEVLILDEPTSGLDPNQLVEIRNLIKKIGQSKTIMLSTHIMQEVEAICNKVIIIDKGNIVANTSTDDLQKSFNKSKVILVEFSSSNIDKKSLNQIKGIITVNKKTDNEWEIISENDIDVRADIFQFAVKNNIAVLSMKVEEQKLEKIFQELTKK